MKFFRWQKVKTCLHIPISRGKLNEIENPKPERKWYHLTWTYHINYMNDFSPYHIEFGSQVKCT